mmetsp:Transcript_91262/g.272392  ORF Transcript_91262/g.272392 Transcript_91262/m.272392 type:complete len:82 (+) Transcript_91262:62-307(+)
MHPLSACFSSFSSPATTAPLCVHLKPGAAIGEVDRARARREAPEGDPLQRLEAERGGADRRRVLRPCLASLVGVNMLARSC